MPLSSFKKTIVEFQCAQINSNEKATLLVSNRDKLLVSLKNKYHELNAMQSASLQYFSQPLMTLDEVMTTVLSNVQKKWDDKQAVFSFSDKYNDRLIILVYGKMNVGKSSLSKYITSLFHDEEIKYFSYENGNINYAQEDIFKVGETETTNKIQGVEIGKTLVLLDSPGLHSNTQCNGDKSQLMTDSADLLLWLTSSASPGQTSELEILKQELLSNKILFPVITASDETSEENINEETQEIEKTRDNKTVEVRNAQAKCLMERMSPLLGDTIKRIREPISISIEMALLNKQSDDALKASGMSEFFYKISKELVSQSELKKQKRTQQVTNHLQQDVVPAIDKLLMTTKNLLAENSVFENKIKKNKEKLEFDLVSFISQIVPEIAHAHSGSTSKSDVIDIVNNRVSEKIKNALSELLCQFEGHIKSIQLVIDQSAIKDVEALEISYCYDQTVRGSTSLGDLARQYIPVPVLNDLVGKAFDSLASTKTETVHVTEKNGESNEQMITSLINEINSVALSKVNSEVDKISQLIAPYKQHISEIECLLIDFQRINKF